MMSTNESLLKTLDIHKLLYESYGSFGGSHIANASLLTNVILKIEPSYDPVSKKALDMCRFQCRILFLI